MFTRLNKVTNYVTLALLVVFVFLITFSISRFDRTEIGDVTYYHHDQSFDDLYRLNSKIQTSLRNAGLPASQQPAHIVLTGSYLEYTLLAPSKRKSFGVTYPFFKIVVIAPHSVLENTVTRNSDSNNTRKLDAVITHEMVHVFIHAKYGGYKSKFIPSWITEGYADYVANDSSFDFDAGMQLFCESKRDPSHSFTYFEYRLLVAHLINTGLSFDQLTIGTFDQVEVTQNTREDICR